MKISSFSILPYRSTVGTIPKDITLSSTVEIEDRHTAICIDSWYCKHIQPIGSRNATLFMNIYMKILLGVPEYPPHHVGGGGPVFAALAHEYQKLGHEVMVVYGYYPTKHGFESILQYEQDGITYIQVPLLPTPSFVPFLKTVLPTGFWNIWKLKKIVQDFFPDRAHIHGYGLLFINQLQGLLTKLSIPYIYTLHGAPVSADKKGGPIMRAYNLYKSTRGKAILDRAADITAVSQYTIDNFTEFHPYRDRIRVVPNGIYPEEFSKKVEYNIYEKYLSIDR